MTFVLMFALLLVLFVVKCFMVNGLLTVEILRVHIIEGHEIVECFDLRSNFSY